MQDPLYAMPAHRLRDLLRAGELGAVELVDTVIARIEAVDGDVGAYLTLTFDKAREAAAGADRRLAEARRAGDAASLPPLLGIPIALKDNLCTAGVRTTCASRMLESFVPPYDAAVVEAVCEAGMPVLGKTNLDEFAMGSSTENSALGVTKNPWDLTRVPGGSSGGSAAAVAAGETVLALGSDTGGSIRQPAAFCGVVGLKPTYGRVSRFGLIAFASSLDQIGPIVRDVEDAALLLEAIWGSDARDSTSLPGPYPDLQEGLDAGLGGMRLGLPREYLGDGLEPAVREAVERAARTCESLGATVEEVSLPHTEHALATYYLIAPAEASSNLARYDGVRYGLRKEGESGVTRMFEATRTEGFGDEVKRRIMLGTYALSAGYYDAYYLKAQKVRTLIRQDFETVFERVDALLTPTSPTVAFRRGERTDDPMAMYLADLCTLPVNLAGLPAVSLPCGEDESGLPIGLQIIAPPLAEPRMLQIARAYEGAAGVGGRCPRIGVKANG